jgi:putative endonuclease
MRSGPGHGGTYISCLTRSRQRYVGVTAGEPKYRPIQHNVEKSSHTHKFKPWKIAAYCAFEQQGKSIEFERYLEKASGHAFAIAQSW